MTLLAVLLAICYFKKKTCNYWQQEETVEYKLEDPG